MLHHYHHNHFKTLTFLQKHTSKKLNQNPTCKPSIINYHNTPHTPKFQSPQKMEIEVKIRLPNKQSHKTLISLLTPFHTKTHNQHNHFFDGAAGQLSSHRAVLRIRFYNDPPKPRCVLSLKAKAILVNGVSRVQEDEEEIDPDEGQRCLTDPTRLRMLVGVSRIMTRVKNEYFSGKMEKGQKVETDPDGRVGSLSDTTRLTMMDGELGFVGLGGFKNLRNVYEWKGLMIEVDETLYEFGTLYEIECESVEPEKAKELIEGFLKENGIEHEDSVMSKFAIFRSGKLP